MKVLIASDARFLQDSDGNIWVPNASAYEAWARYLEVFDQIDLLARVSRIETTPEQYLRVDGAGVRVVGMPYYEGPFGYLRKARESSVVAQEVVRNAEAILLRSPGQIANITAGYIPSGRPFGVEVLGDPYDVFSPGAVKHPLRRLFRSWFPRQQKRIVREATAIAFVTERYLQQRYHPSAGAFSTSYSDQGYPDSMYIPAPRPLDVSKGRVHVVTVASLEQMYKGVDTLLPTVANCRRAGIDMELTIVGDGKHRKELEELAGLLSIRDSVSFLGHLPSGAPVVRQLDNADLFVLASRTEGLPRALIEAMAQGLPAIGTTVGGIPELLEADDMVPPGDINALTSKILEVVRDPYRLSRMSERNWHAAQRFGVEKIRNRRNELLVELQNQTQKWLSNGVLE